MKPLRRLAEDDPSFAKFVTFAETVKPRPEVLQGLLQKLPPPPQREESTPSRLRRWAMITAAGGCALAGITAFELSRATTPPPRETPLAHETTPPPRPENTNASATSSSSAQAAILPSIHVDDLPIAPRAEASIVKGPAPDVPTPTRLALREPSVGQEPKTTPEVPAKSLGREIALISAARAALTAGDAAKCLAALHAHEVEFPKGQFALEARAMRVEATAARGDRQRARELAREFLARHPQSPYEERVRSLLSSLETP